MHRQRRLATPTFLTEKCDGAHNIPLTVLHYGCVDVSMDGWILAFLREPVNAV
jgi:hypothetical protein